MNRPHYETHAQRMHDTEAYTALAFGTDEPERPNITAALCFVSALLTAGILAGLGVMLVA